MFYDCFVFVNQFDWNFIVIEVDVILLKLRWIHFKQAFGGILFICFWRQSELEIPIVGNVSELGSDCIHILQKFCSFRNF